MDALRSQSPSGMPATEELKCCCGKRQCVFLQSNAVILERLEQDVQLAAFAGSALLARHESNMVEAESKRNKMALSIEVLETEKRALEISNARTIEENRALLDQLEQMNEEVTYSDSQIKALTNTLDDTRREIGRLTILAGRTSQLEAQLLAMELDQKKAQDQLMFSEEENRCSIQRIKRAERTIEHLNEQVDKIEREAREDRERHVEVVGRIERRTTVEHELSTAADRLKGTAAMTTNGKLSAGSGVVSHFVRDILQDNANLQLGVVELRELLMASNEEVERLRARMVADDIDEPDRDDRRERATLDVELNRKTPLEALPELHVHHHYHGSRDIPKDRQSLYRKPKKRRNIVSSAIFTPPSGMQTPRSSKRFQAVPPPSASSVNAILSHMSVSTPQDHNMIPSKRWSIQSSQTGRSSFNGSSVPSSPQSGFRSSVIFDNISTAMDSSRPSTPESSYAGSPPLLGQDHVAKLRATPFQASLIPGTMPWKLGTVTARSPMPQLDTTSISSKPEQQRSASSETMSTLPETPFDTVIESVSDSPDLQGFDFIPGNRLRRANSHDSLFSLSGMDIHTPRSRPPRLLRSDGSGLRNPSFSLSPTSNLSLSAAAISSQLAIAHLSLQHTIDSSSYHRSILANHKPRRPSVDDNSSKENNSRSTSIGERVGGWVFGKWGVAPARSIDNLRAKAAMQRPSGVNQAGPISGFIIKPTPSQVEAREVNEHLLRESLGEG
ncbi:hypothetical protein MMC25_004722 [Agyrium rufum]|nr:hypothetical protein [Agyrium rufum]